jgi:two-component system sensor histidine kinase KdpD
VVLYVAQTGRGLDPTRARAHQDVEKALQLAQELGAEVIRKDSGRVADTIVDVANEVNATQIVMGESNRSWIRELLRGSTTREILRRTTDVDVHIVNRRDAR